MESGLLRDRVRLERPEYSVNEYGEKTLTWVLVRSVWARIQSLRAREILAAQAVQSEVSKDIFIRFCTDIEPTWRIVHKVNGKDIIYNIHGIMTDRNTGREHLRIPCSQGMNNGE